VNASMSVKQAQACCATMRRLKLSLDKEK